MKKEAMAKTKEQSLKSLGKIPVFLASLLVAAIGVAACGTSTPATTGTTTRPPTTKTPATATEPATPATTTASQPATSASSGRAVTLNGAGATFPAPLYSRWFDVYFTQNNVKINYQAVGSGAGITQITEGTVDFGASDGIMTADQQTKAEAAHGPILHIPMTAGSVAVIYNIPGQAGTQIKLTGDVLADIYLKKITSWNDARITALNAGVTLPASQIAVVHRSDGSGTTNIFTNYLSKVSDNWKTNIGSGNSVNWPG
jgi:phosphate transport system substrate-binding protein